MVSSKTPGGQVASDKFQKQQQEKQGLGASNAPGATSGHAPGEAPVASDSGSTNVGVKAGENLRGEKGIKGVPVNARSEGKVSILVSEGGRYEYIVDRN